MKSGAACRPAPPDYSHASDKCPCVTVVVDMRILVSRQLAKQDVGL